MKEKIIRFISEYGLIVGGTFMLLIGLNGVRNGYLDKEITEINNKVTVRVIDCYETGRRNYFLKFEFNNNVFVKRTKAQYCREVQNADKIELISNLENDRFIFPDEYETNNDSLFGLILMGVALIIIYKGIKARKTKLDDKKRVATMYKNNA